MSDKGSNVDLQPWRHLQIWLFCGGVLAVLYGYARDPAWVEHTYVEGWGSLLARSLSALTAPVPFAVGEAVILAAILYEVVSAATAMSEVGAGRRRLGNALAGGLFHALDLTMVLLACFYLSWGVTYAREPAIVRLQWEELAPTGELTPETVEDLARMVTLATDRVHTSYRALHGGSLDDPEITQVREGLDVDAAVDAGFARAGAALGLHESFSRARGPVKTPLLSELMSWGGIGGIYLPYTGEANVNGGAPAWGRVMTGAHEKGHQRMIASEDEASFYGFLACVYSDDPLLQYGAWHFARGQLLRVLDKADRERATELRALLADGPRRDLQDRWDYWKAYEGWLEEAHHAVNDTYLKLNQVEGGVLAYGRSGRLVVAWLRSEPGEDRVVSLR